MAVERTISWLHARKKLRTHYERRDDIQRLKVANIIRPESDRYGQHHCPPLHSDPLT